LPAASAEWRAVCGPTLGAAGDVCLAYYALQVGIGRSVFRERFRECNHRGRIDLADFFRRHGMPYDTPPFYTCCSDATAAHIITCHNMSLDDMDAFYRLRRE